MSNLILDQTFENKNFTNQKLPAKEYDNCTFMNCDFSKTDMSVVTFLECKFDTCNFNETMLKETSFQDIVFMDCKLLGANFSICNNFLFAVEFNRCNLDYVSFYSFNIKKTLFRNCSMKEIDFTETILTGSQLDNCDLTGAIFEKTIAEKVDFRTANNFVIDPEINNLKKARFTTSGLVGLLTKHDLEVE